MLDAAAFTLWASGAAHGAAVVHHPMAEIGRFFRRQDFAQLHFDFNRFLYVDKADAVCEADAVRIHHDGGWSVVHILSLIHI